MQSVALTQFSMPFASLPSSFIVDLSHVFCIDSLIKSSILCFFPHSLKMWFTTRFGCQMQVRCGAQILGKGALGITLRSAASTLRSGTGVVWEGGLCCTLGSVVVMDLGDSGWIIGIFGGGDGVGVGLHSFCIFLSLVVHPVELL